MQRLISALAATLLAATATAQLSVVIPQGCDVAPGDTSNAFPWGTSASSWGGLRLMATYGAVNFTNQSVTTPIIITQLKWRPNETYQAVAGGQFNIATVELSTSPVGWSGVSTNYASNHGPDRTVVYDAALHGPVIYTATPGAAAWTVNSWCVDIQLATPFLYDPAAGDLVIDVDYPSGSFAGGGVGQMDVQAANSNASRVYASSNYPAANGVSQNHGVVVEVGYAPAQGFAMAEPFGAGCYEDYASFYETFSGPIDLNGQSLQAIYTGASYLVLASGNQWFTPTSTPIAFNDEDVQPHSLGWTLPYPGGSTTSLWISSNGFIYLTANTDAGCCMGSNALLLSSAFGPRWAGLWNDLNPSASTGGGSIYFDSDPVSGTAYVTFDQVPHFGTSDLNTFQFAFDQSGNVELRYAACNIQGGTTLIGWSPGADNLDPGSTDLSAITSLVLAAGDVYPLALSADARPVLGTTVNLSVDNIPASSILSAVIYGLTKLDPGMPLGSIGMPGCEQYCSTDAVVLLLAPTSSHAFVIPNVNVLAGVQIVSQGACYDPAGGHNALGALSSNGIGLMLDVN